MEKIRVTLDCDDLLLDFATSYIDWHNLTYGTNGKKSDMRTYYYSDLFGIDEAVSVERVRAFSRTPLYGDLPAIPGAQRLIRSLSRVADISINTVRGANRAGTTRANLERRFGIAFPRIFCIHPLDPGAAYKTKAEACAAIGSRLHIDDNQDHVRGCNDHTPRIRAILYAQPWNLDVTIPDVQRAKDHDETLAHALDILRQG